MVPAYEEFEATNLFCTRCKKTVPVRKKLLLVLPTGTKYDYLCAECGTPVGAKLDEDPAEFHRMTPPRAVPGRPGFPGPVGPRSRDTLPRRPGPDGRRRP